ncbi:hypothetical protein REH81_17950 [Vibrio rotiferianus]
MIGTQFLKSVITGLPFEQVKFGVDGTIAVCLLVLIYTPYHIKRFGEFMKPRGEK